MQIWTWITSNWTEIIAAIGGIVLAARIIVKLTPSETDNVWQEMGQSQRSLEICHIGWRCLAGLW